MRRRETLLRIALLLLAGLALAACESLQPYETETLAEQYRSVSVLSDPDFTPPLPTETTDVAAAEKPAREDDKRALFEGTGRFVRPPREGAAGAQEEPGDITLNFENTNIREVVKVILGDLLQVNYLLDPGVQGGVTMQTARPLRRDALLPTLETLLQMNGAAVVLSNGMYHVVPAGKAMKGTLTPQLADAASPLPAGYGVRVVPLRHIGANEMSDILQPLIREGNIVRVDARRNLLVLAGAGRELEYIMETIRTFDVDWLDGMSVGFFELQFASVENVQRDVEAILGASGAEMMDGLLRIVPIQAANGMLVVSPRKEYLRKIETWIRRLDRIEETGGSEARLFVYRVKNGEAADLAGLLNSLFGSDKKEVRQEEGRGASIAPGFEPKEVTSSGAQSGTTPVAAEAPRTAARTTSSVIKSGETAGLGGAQLEAEIRVVADENNNSLLIMATPRDFQRISGVLEQLDIVPLQVHIEATIVEVALSGKLEYGIEWFFKSSLGDYGTRGSLNLGNSLSAVVPGFSWSLIDNANQVRAVLNAFAGDGRINVLSAPSVMVLDNQTARIQVGDQVPTAGGTTTTGGGDSITNVQYRDTGVLLTVTPRVNPGGLVFMEVSQEVSESVYVETNVEGSPTIQNRNIDSTVAVQSGQSVVLGGLIRTKQEETQGGIPGLYSLPVVGSLFGETVGSKNRTELVVVLTPRVIASAEDIRRITEDFRTKMRGLEGSF